MDSLFTAPNEDWMNDPVVKDEGADWTKDPIIQPTDPLTPSNKKPVAEMYSKEPYKMMAPEDVKARYSELKTMMNTNRGDAGFPEGFNLQEYKELEQKITMEESSMEREALEDQLGRVPFNLRKSDISAKDRFLVGDLPNPIDKLKHLKTTYPDYEFLTLQTKDNPSELFYRNKEDGVVYPVNPRGIESGDISEAIGEFSPVQAGVEAVALALTRGMTRPMQVLGSAVGSALSPFVKKEIDQSRGFAGSEDVGRDSATQAGLAVVGELGSTILKRLDKVKSGGGILELSDRAKTDIEIGKKYNLADLTPGQLNPIMARKERQLYGTQAETFDDYYEFQDKSLLTSIEDFKASLDKGGIENYTDEQRDALHNQVVVNFFDKFTNPKVSLKEGGETLQTALNDYIGVQKGYFNKRYDDVYASAQGKVAFDLSSVQASADELLKGVEAPTSEGAIRVSPNYTGSMVKAMEDLQQILPTVSDIDIDNGSALEVMKGLRSQFFSLSQPSNGINRNEAEGAMYRLYKEVNGAISAPIGGGEEFIDSWKALNKDYKDFTTIYDFKEVTNILDTNQPEKLVRNLFVPENETVMETLKARLPAESWKKFTDAVTTDLLSDPSVLGRRMRQFKGNDPTLSFVFDDITVDRLKAVGRKVERADNSSVASMLQGSKDAASAVADMVGKGETKLLREYIKSGGDDFVSLLKVGTLSDVVQKSMEPISVPIKDVAGNIVGTEVAYKINPKKFTSNINTLNKNGVLDEVFGSDKDQLIERALWAFRKSGATDPSMADSLQASAIVADLNVTNLFRHPEQFLHSAIHLKANKMEAAIFLSNSFRDIVFGHNPTYKPGFVASNAREASVLMLNGLNRMIDFSNDASIIPDEFKSKIEQIKSEYSNGSGEADSPDLDYNDTGRLGNVTK